MSQEYLQLLAFSLLLFFFYLLEYLFPAFHSINNKNRKLTNISIGLFNFLIGSSLSIFFTLFVANFCKENNFGLFNFFKTSLLLQILTCLIIKSFFQYFFHILSHKNKILWKFHEIHHSDMTLDITSAFRFQPIELFFSKIFFVPFILIFGWSFVVLVLIEFIDSIYSIFSHLNIKIPLKIEKALRLFLITPILHRYHHSKDIYESNRNYGGIFTIWDKLFNTYFEPADRQVKPINFGVNRIIHKSLIEVIESPFSKI